MQAGNESSNLPRKSLHARKQPLPIWRKGFRKKSCLKRGRVSSRWSFIMGSTVTFFFQPEQSQWLRKRICCLYTDSSVLMLFLWGFQYCLIFSVVFHFVPINSLSHDGDVAVYGFFLDEQLSLPTPFFSVVSVSVDFVVVVVVVLPFQLYFIPWILLTTFCFLTLLFQSYLCLTGPVNYMKVSFSPNIILCGWLGLMHPLTNSHSRPVLILHYGKSGSSDLQRKTGCFELDDICVQYVLHFQKPVPLGL